MARISKTRRPVLVVVATLSALALAAPAASAGPLVASAENCEDGAIERPFLRWLDPAEYVLAPNGTLEAGGGEWSLQGSSVVSGNEPYYVHAPGESYSLALPAGSSATTASICVGIEHPTLRFFARSSGSLTTSLRSALKVEVLFEDGLGNVRSLLIGAVPASSRWQPTLPYPVLANLLPLLPGEHTAVAFRFTPSGGANWWIDDIYVDPKMRG